MKKKEILILLVQTWVLAHGTKRSSDPLHKAMFAVYALHYLCCCLDVMDENQLPTDLAAAAGDYCKWEDQNGDEGIPRPKWLPPTTRPT